MLHKPCLHIQFDFLMHLRKWPELETAQFLQDWNAYEAH